MEPLQYFYFLHSPHVMGDRGWTEVIAETEELARAAFVIYCPDAADYPEEVRVLNEKQFTASSLRARGLGGEKCVQVIQLRRMVIKKPKGGSR